MTTGVAGDDSLVVALRPPRAGAAPPVHGVIKTSPADFEVVELPAITPDGEGAHQWLEIEREDMNTAYAVRLLARAAGVAERDIGYAGLKDRHARTRQWFSIPAPEGEQAPGPALEAAGLTVLRAVRHGRKLRRGSLAGNRFRIRVRVAQGSDAGLESALARIRRDGVPNYFGPQRFGHDGANVARARAMLCDGVRVRDRHRRGLFLSAARSLLFNRVLATRVDDGSWNRLLPGEAVSLAGSASYFVAEEVDEALEARLRAFDVHPSGPLWGRGGSPAVGRAHGVEMAALAGCEALMNGIGAAGGDAARRALRLCVTALQAHRDDDAWVLGFDLVPGAYATVVLRELFEFEDASIRSG